MNESLENSTLFTRLFLIALSSAFVIIPQILWNLFGYGGILLIAIETLSIFAGFFFLLLGLINPLPRLLQKIAIGVWAKFESSAEKKTVKKLLPFGMIGYTIYILVPIFLSGIQQFKGIPLDLELLFAIFTMVLLSLIATIHFRETKKGKSLSHWYYLPIVALTIVWATMFWYGSPNYPTDEMILDFYSAHLFLQGINPYIASNTAGVFTYIHSTMPGYPLSVGTPILTGGLVTNLSYPALAFLTYLPAQLLGVPPTETLLPLFALPSVLIFSAYSKIRNRSLALLPVFLLLLNPGYLAQTALGYPDIVWVTLLMFSLYFYRKPAISGFTLGLSMAVKQIPWLVFPFFFIFIYRELGRKKATPWLILAATGFFLPNIVYIIHDPITFFRAILSPAFDPIMGVGFGPSQLAFLGILPLSKEFFTISVLTLGVSFIILYVFYYERLKYAFIAFPLIIFLFNYRFLVDYVVFWPIIALILPVRMKSSQKETVQPSGTRMSLTTRNKVIAVIVTLVLLGVPIAFHESHNQPGDLSIGHIAVSSLSDGNITSLTLDLTISGSNLTYGQVMYRIIPWSPTPNLNGFLWHYTHVHVENNTAKITLIPDNSLQQISFNGKYRIIAYYGTRSATGSFEVNQGIIT